MLPPSPLSTKLLERLHNVENEICAEASLVTVCSSDDANEMHARYNLDLRKTIKIQNGVDLRSVKFVDPESRSNLKKAVRLENAKCALFMGSHHKPNIVAVNEIVNIAKQVRDVYFIIVGGVCDDFSGRDLPKNIGLMGMVDDEEKDVILSLVDCALNPMMTGSGTNMKMLDYLAAGLPVISTVVGARGLDLPEGFITICPLEEFRSHLNDPVDREQILVTRRFVEEHFDWAKIAKTYTDALMSRI
jgi:glycosyltransferase involved in cell wall biosynthesis